MSAKKTAKKTAKKYLSAEQEVIQEIEAVEHKIKLDKDKKRKAKLQKNIEDSDSCLLITFGNGGGSVSYTDYNVAYKDIISACEVVKASILKKVIL